MDVQTNALENTFGHYLSNYMVCLESMIHSYKASKNSKYIKLYKNPF